VSGTHTLRQFTCYDEYNLTWYYQWLNVLRRMCQISPPSSRPIPWQATRLKASRISQVRYGAKPQPWMILVHLQPQKTFLVAKYYRDLWLWLNCQTSPIRYQISPNRSTPDLSCQVMGPRSGTIRLWKTYRSVQIWTIRYDTKCISHSKADG